MRVINARNVNDAYAKGIQYLRTEGVKQQSRAGEVLVSPVPVTTVYSHPQERVLFNAERDANPFFHLFEALWMLSGSNDAKFLDRFVRDFSSRFAEEDGHQHGAYGYRWRYHFDLDGGGHPRLPNQLDLVVALLKKNPDDRRVVITMWDPVADLGADQKDIPCNTHAYLRVREGMLDITVCCRSNDAIWGAYGANAVHFSVLQEYLAVRIGVGIGKYYQISNNFHAYTVVLDKLASPWDNHDYETVKPQRMIESPDDFETDLAIFFSQMERGKAAPWMYVNPWFANTAEPLLEAHQAWRAQAYERAHLLLGNEGMAPDWQLAARRWVQRRMAKVKQGELT